MANNQPMTDISPFTLPAEQLPMAENSMWTLIRHQDVVNCPALTLQTTRNSILNFNVKIKNLNINFETVPFVG